nr:ABC transporter ATP-binding protein [Microvirga antarctica]
MLKVRNLSVYFRLEEGVLTAVDRISFDVFGGQILGLVGESGSGKSMSMLALARLIPQDIGIIAADELSFDGEPVLSMNTRQLKALRGPGIGFIFQNPLSSLNPLLTIGSQISESLRSHMGLSRKAAATRTIDLLARVGIPDPKQRVDDYPHQFSGGMRQRAMIAMAIACEPKLILADEPTTALDVTIQAQILELLVSIVEETGAGVIIVTHDLGVAANICDHVNVMYAGQIVESAPVDDLFYRPSMPYTWGLLDSIPRIDHAATDVLPFIGGRPPDPMDFGSACRFAPRCSYARPACIARMPNLSDRDGVAHLARCLGTESSGWLEVQS